MRMTSTPLRRKKGNAFRAWINDNYPFYAQNVNLDRTGDPRNGYLQQAYFELGSEYQKSYESDTTISQ